MSTITIPGFYKVPPGFSEAVWPVPPLALPDLEHDLKHGAVLNGPEHPIPVLGCYSVAPDVATYGHQNPTASVFLHGKRVARVHYEGGGCRTVMIEPEEVEAASVVLWPAKESLEDPE